MEKKRRHHYVQKALASHFQAEPTEGGRLFLYDTEPENVLIRPVMPENCFVIRDLHTVNNSDIVDYNTVEDQFNIIEGPGITAIREYIRNEMVTDIERDAIAQYWALQIVRTPFKRREVELMLKEALTMTLDVNLAHDPDAPPIPKGLLKYGKTMSEIIANGGAVLKIAPHVSLYSLKQLPTTFQVLRQMNWCLLKSPDQRYAVSDNPCSFYSNAPSTYGLGLGTPGAELVFPIHKNYALVASFKDLPPTAIATAKQVDEINLRTAIYGTRFYALPYESESMWHFFKAHAGGFPEVHMQRFPTENGQMLLSRQNMMLSDRAKASYGLCQPLFDLPPLPPKGIPTQQKVSENI